MRGSTRRRGSTLAEAPPGHLEIRLVVLHALWDAWIHERDIVLPLGLDPVEEPDEIIASASPTPPRSDRRSWRPPAPPARGRSPSRCASPTPSSSSRSASAATVIRSGHWPVGAARLDGAGVELLEALSFRRPLDPPSAARREWMLDGLAEVFDVAV